MGFRIISSRATILLLVFLVCVSMMVPSHAEVAESSGYAATCDYMKMDININDGYAVTTIEEKLDNMNSFPITDKAQFLIPENAFMSGLSITIDGTEYQADVLKKEQAHQEFEAAAAIGRTTALLESHGSELFSYSINIEANQSVTVKLTYEQALSRETGEYEYLQYLRGDHEVNDLKVLVNINSSTDVLSVETPEFNADITYPSTNSALVEFTSDTLPEKDMNVVFKTENTGTNGEMLFYETDGTGYFMHIFSPTAQEVGASSMNKDIVFVIDHSSSMDYLKMRQVKTAFPLIIDELPEDDRFNVVVFNTSVQAYSDQLLSANSSNKESSIDFVMRAAARGRTNINDALLMALGMFQNDSENVPIVVFLTDGMPSVRVRSTETIRQNVLEANKFNASIFSIAFGEEKYYDFEFLQAMSFENGGTAVYFEANSEAAGGITHFYDTISTPLVSDIEFSYDEGTSNVVVNGKEHLFVGSESMILGNYDVGSDSVTYKVSGVTRNGDYLFENEFPILANDTNDMIPRLWAYNTIMSKLDRMKVVSETEELVSEITELSLEYGFVTPYTSFFMEVPQAEYVQGEVIPEETLAGSDSYELTSDEILTEEAEEVEEIMIEDNALEEDISTEDTPGFSSLLSFLMFIFVLLTGRVLGKISEK